MHLSKNRHSTFEYVLLALVPYTKANLQLTFQPSRFFSELEKISQANRASLQSTLARATRQGYVERTDGVPRLTEKGRERVQPYTAKVLAKNVLLMVAFDIPEEEAHKRRQLRSFLRQREFTLAQRSLWTTTLDYRTELSVFVQQTGISQYVDIYECAKLRI